MHDQIDLDAVAGPQETLSERAATILRRSVLTGELPPGSKLKVAALAKTYGIGVTPLREGLSRLVTMGLVEAIGHRGFRVVAMSRKDLEDILRVRTIIEEEALRLSIERGDDRWEADIVAALHRLSRFAQKSGNSIQEGELEFDQLHKNFHTSLLAACGSPRLIELHSQLYDQTYRYRRVAMRKERPSAVDREHQELAQLALSRRVDAACEKLRQHLAITLEMTYGSEAMSSARRGSQRVKPRKHAA